jgi:hypothetical protein
METWSETSLSLSLSLSEQFVSATVLCLLSRRKYNVRQLSRKHSPIRVYKLSIPNMVHARKTIHGKNK